MQPRANSAGGTPKLTFFDAEMAALSAVLRDAMALTQADRGNIQGYSPTDKSLSIVVQRGFEEEFLRTFDRVLLDDKSACARAMRARKPILIPDVSLDEDFAEYRGIAQRAGFVSVLSVPLVTDSEKFVGVLSVHFEKMRSPNDIRMDVLDDYVGYAANGLAGSFSRLSGRFT